MPFSLLQITVFTAVCAWKSRKNFLRFFKLRVFFLVFFEHDKKHLCLVCDCPSCGFVHVLGIVGPGGTHQERSIHTSVVSHNNPEAAVSMQQSFGCFQTPKGKKKR
eukprot:TRINITY_DN11812_c0_g1_i1.p1 TRINITY_DN11812_c0_g1~~TRINITY_DN11812_c0_g1_i1.p1  ORF type:complete len:106 (+),score=3.60 TRINITY_DN11812_c0_g1_i1:77-394(+)